MERIRTLTARDRDEVRDIWAQLFDDSPTFIDWFFTERYSPDTSVCLETDGRIASVMQGAPMQLRLRGNTVPAMMISGVSTRPEYRGRGCMRRVMAAMMQLARENGCAAVFDKPANLPTFFGLGHLPCSDTLYYMSDSDAPMPRFSPEPDTDLLHDCYAAATARYSGCVVRTRDEMDRKLRDYRSDGGQCLLLKAPDGCAAGYCIAFVRENGLWCEETLARSEADYMRLLSLLPRGAVAKLPPDVRAPGRLRPQNVLGAADIRQLLRLVLHDESVVLSVTDPLVPQNNGVFDGRGQPSSLEPQAAFTAGVLTQALSGYRALPGRLPKLACYCVDEY